MSSTWTVGMNSKTDNETQQLRDEVETLRARVEELEASRPGDSALTNGPDGEEPPPTEIDYFETPQGRIVLFVVAVSISVIIIQVLRKIF